MWTSKNDGTGALRYDEFGGEAQVCIRAWPSTRLEFNEVRSEARRQRSSTSAVWGEEHLEQVEGRSTAWVTGIGDERWTYFHATVDAGELVFFFTWHDVSERDQAAVISEARRALESLDPTPWIARLAAVGTPSGTPPHARTLVPWLAQPNPQWDEPLPGLELQNGLVMCVAGLADGIARIVGPSDPRWAEVGGTGLLQVARLNLVRRMTEDEVPTRQLMRSPFPAVLLGPHPLAHSLVALPDFHLWAWELAGFRPARAHFPRREMLVVTGQDADLEALGLAWLRKAPWADPMDVLNQPPKPEAAQASRGKDEREPSLLDLFQTAEDS